ncbi:hypothetical protein OFN40_29000, partial [Escherichia coli]|nr:hypothetical protein [Escherichia coli]
SVTFIAHRIPITLPTDAVHRLIKSSLRWAFFVRKTYQTGQPSPFHASKKRDQNHSVEKQSRED